MPKERSQATERKHQYLRDQHGRQWSATIEKETLRPSGAIIPIFTAPLIPPAAYVKPHPGSVAHVVIRYDLWLAALAEAHRNYRDVLRNVARGLHGQSSLGKADDPTEDMKAIAGPPPQAIEPVMAASQGQSRWILGLPDKKTGEPFPMPGWARPFFQTEKAVDPMLSTRIFTDDPEEEDEAEPQQPEAPQQPAARTPLSVITGGAEAPAAATLPEVEEEGLEDHDLQELAETMVFDDEIQFTPADDLEDEVSDPLGDEEPAEPEPEAAPEPAKGKPKSKKRGKR